MIGAAGFRVEPLSVHWRSLRVKLKGRDALKGCSGDAPSGSLLAVMGPSGGGKTTLINALSRRGPVSAGQIRYGGVNGESWSPNLKRRVALVEQDDQVLSALTVGETLRYGAALRLSHLPPAERDARVSALVATLRLGACESTRVGDSSSAATRGISGGERKRLCIACELLTLPSLLFCDEPSSGLDSSMAFVVVDVLRELAKSHGVTVIASIHQPSSQVCAHPAVPARATGRAQAPRLSGASRMHHCANARTCLAARATRCSARATPGWRLLHAPPACASCTRHLANSPTHHPVAAPDLSPRPQVFALFDDLLLLKGGLAMYHGPRSGAAHRFCAVLGQTRPVDFSAADWLMDVLVRDSLSPAQEERMRKLAASSWPAFGDGPGSKPPPALPGPPRPSWRYQASMLTRRAWRLARGTIWVHEVAFLQVVIGLLSGILFWRIGYEADDIRARFSASFLLGLNFMFFPLLASLHIVPSAEPMLRKDLQNGAYSLSAWFVPTTSIALLPELTMMLVNTPLLYWLSGVADDAGAFVPARPGAHRLNLPVSRAHHRRRRRIHTRQRGHAGHALHVLLLLVHWHLHPRTPDDRAVGPLLEPPLLLDLPACPYRLPAWHHLFLWPRRRPAHYSKRSSGRAGHGDTTRHLRASDAWRGCCRTAGRPGTTAAKDAPPVARPAG